MYTVFRSPTLTTRHNIEQENNVIAKKPGSQSVRKPFGERSANVATNQTPSVKPKQIPKIVIKNDHQTDDDLLSDQSFYMNSYKDVKDTFNDLLTDRDRLGKKGWGNIRRSFLYENDVAEPKITWKLRPEFIEIKSGDKIDFDFDFNFNINVNDFNLGLKDVPLPVIDF